MIVTVLLQRLDILFDNLFHGGFNDLHPRRILVPVIIGPSELKVRMKNDSSIVIRGLVDHVIPVLVKFLLAILE